ncbi:MAG: response regulator [Clostridia bacterium]|nr:response regulator [Clostridia bacterium]
MTDITDASNRRIKIVNNAPGSILTDTSMKTILNLLCVLLSIQVVASVNIDSLVDAARNTSYSDSLRLKAYEDITLDLINTNGDSCRLLCEEGAVLAKTAGNAVFEVSFYARIGKSYYFEGNYSKLAYYWTEALRVSEASGDPFIIAQSLNNLGVLYQSIQTDYDKAIDYYTRAVEYKKIVGDTASMIMTRMNIGTIYMDAMRLQEAQQVFEELLPMIDLLKNPRQKYSLYVNIATNYSKIASNQNKIKYFYDALKYFFLAENELNKTNNVFDRAGLMLNIGETYLQLNDYEKGFTYLNESLKLARENDASGKRLKIYMVLRNHFLSINDYKKAYSYQDSVIMMNDTINRYEAQKALDEVTTRYESEKKEAENQQLQEQMTEQQARSRRIIVINYVFLAVTTLLVIFAVVVILLIIQIRKRNQLLLKSQHDLEVLNQNLKHSNQETEQALAFRSQFMANMSHEIRTPLNIIIGFNTFLNKNIEDPQLKKYTESIEVSSYNLLQFLNDILDMSKIEANRVTLNSDRVNLRFLAQGIRELFVLKAQEKDISFLLDINKCVPHEVILDEVRLRQIMMNLVGNAIKFTDIGHVSVTIDCAGTNNFSAQMSGKTNIRIQIEDTGMGIDAADQEIIFEPFRQVNQKEQKKLGGSGLGLAISRRLTEMMNGRIALTSEKGKGSTFAVYFDNVPVVYEISSATAPAKKPPTQPIYDFKNSLLLIADDEVMNRDLIKTCFEKTNLRIIEAENGAQAIEMALSYKPALILMDLKMSMVDGLEATRAIKNDAEGGKIKILAFSASEIFGQMPQQDHDLFAGLITKPLILDELYNKTAEILPHTISFSDKDDGVNNEDDFDFAEDLPAMTHEIGNTLRNDFLLQWHQIIETNAMNKYLAFAADLYSFATQHQLNELALYASTMSMAVKKFDTQKVKQLLQHFPQIIGEHYTFTK